ncbi:MAG TPA: UDP-4-amino-4,6-dideoxy-N-acetyl-beta-L-altrosamine transaminase [Polyangiaceae bacterium]|nr:UDP-4-amino-4,6-dideoxy-N-acetyl-beta-L-altrosamine transaminase [Polyangiaceae bacterium]
MTDAFLPYGRQSIDEADIAAVIEVLKSSHLTQGPGLARFEEELASVLEAPHVSAVASGTAALHLAYAALGLGPGDELITSPITFLATANAARLLGAEVRFGDVDEHGNLDPDSIERLITPRTKGITAVHFAGMPADMPRLSAHAQRHGLWLVEDAAHALGAHSGSRPVGACEWSDVTTFSFHPVKHITTGEGGAISTRSAKLKQKVDRLREHGIERRPAPDSDGHFGYVMEVLGWNYRLSDLNCALGCSQLSKLSGWVARRRVIARRYREGLAHLRAAGLGCLSEADGRSSAHHLFPVQIEFDRLGRTRGQLMGALKARGIGTQVHYIPVCDQPYYLERGQTHCPRARDFYARELSLPMYASLADADVERVIAAVCEIIERPMAAAV